MGGSVADAVADPREGELSGPAGTGEGRGAHVELSRELLFGVELGDVGDGVHRRTSARTPSNLLPSRTAASSAPYAHSTIPKGGVVVAPLPLPRGR